MWINQSDIVLIGLRDYQVKLKIKSKESSEKKNRRKTTHLQDAKADVILTFDLKKIPQKQ